MLDYKLCWDQHVNYLFGKCNKGFGMIKRARYFLPTSCLLSLYNAFVYPYVQNGIELYGTAGVTYLHPLKIILKSCIYIHIICSSYCTLYAISQTIKNVVI